MIEESIVKSVEEKTDIVRLIGEYVQLRRYGRSLKGLCPFHHEKTPSFSVNPERKAFYCFGCGVGGTVFTFLMRMENLKFPEAVEKLAARAGIEIPRSPMSPVAVSRYREKKSLLGTMKLAQEYFLSSFLDAQGAACRAYAHHRGISDEMIAAFALGFAPDSWDGILNTLHAGGASFEDAEKLGLVGKRDSGGYYAKFRNRLMFPVHNQRGEIIAFGGRILVASETAKYINSPETELYTKGEHLYGLYQAKTHIVREKHVILVEGNIDVVMMHGYGFRETVASMGTALTPKQAELLYKSLPETSEKTLYLMYDGDSAGRKAMIRALGILIQQDFSKLLAVELPPGDDPDSFLRTYGADGLNALLASAQPLAQWCITRQCDAIMQLAPELRKAGYAELGHTLNLFTNPTVRQHYLGEAARQLGLDIRTLSEAVQERAGRPRSEMADAHALSADVTADIVHAEELLKRINPVECEVTRLLLLSEKRFCDFEERHGLDLIQEPALRALLQDYRSIEDRQNAWSVENHLSPAAHRLYECLVCRDSDISDDELDQWYDGALATLMKTWAETERRKLSVEIMEAIRSGDEARSKELVERNKQLIALLKESSAARKYLWERHRS